MIVKRNPKIFTILLLIFAIFASGFQPWAVSAAGQGKQGSISVIGENGAQLYPETTVQYGDNENGFDALLAAVGKDNVTYTQYSFGKMIDSIYNVAGTSDYSKYWSFFIDGISAQVGADNYLVQNGDKLTFQYVDTAKPLASVSLNVIGQNNEVLNDFSGTRKISIIGQPTALQLLQVTLGSDKVGLKDTQYGPMITSIDGIEAQGNSYWGFYVNGQYANEGANTYKLQPNDQISFKLETFTPSPSNGDSSSSTGATNSSTTPTKSEPFASDKLQSAIDLASQYTLNNWTDDNIWGAIALKQAGKTIPASFLQALTTNIQNKAGKFHYITDAEKYTLGVLAAGENPTTIAGYNLIESIYNGDVTKQGLNGVAYALIALDSPNFSIPSSAIWTRDRLINQLLSAQKADGHWSLSANDSSSDIDMTAMALTALAPYKDQADVKDKVNNAVDYLASQYNASKIDNSSTAAQVVIALSALGLDANDPKFTKNKISLLQYLLSFQNTDGGFGWKAGDASDTFSTPQGFQGLVAYQLYVKGKGSLFHLPLTVKINSVSTTDVPSQQTQAQTTVSDGKSLPNTATNSENLLLLGGLLVMIGMVLVYVNNRRKA